MSRKLILVLIFSFILPLTVFADVSTGFVEQSVWFSNEPDKVGETILISTLVNNQSDKAIFGTVAFYDEQSLLGKKTVTVEVHSAKVVSISWKVTKGNHSILAKFEDPKISNSEGQSVVVSNAITAPQVFEVIAPAPTPITTETKAESTVSDKNKTESDVSKTVDAAKDAAETTFEKLDDFRETTSLALASKAVVAADQIAQIKNDAVKGKILGASTTKDSILKTPFAYLKMFFYKLAHFIFSHKYVFYGLIILIIVLFFRYLIRAPR
jgi:hypothetical protein